ncbi:hypothetical protein V8C34DRAFT_218696 [Trichoderma compactum]
MVVFDNGRFVRASHLSRQLTVTYKYTSYRSSVGISNPPAFERRHLTFPSIATAGGRSSPLSLLPCAACAGVSKMYDKISICLLWSQSDVLYDSRIVAGLFGHLWCYPLQLACTFQSTKEQTSLRRSIGSNDFPTASFIIASFSASSTCIFLPQARPPCPFRLCLPPIHNSWLRILFLRFFFSFLSFLEFPLLLALPI